MFIESQGVISDKSLFELVKKSVEGKNLKKVLLLPPDYTRMYSGAGKITNMYYNLLKDSCIVDIMPALGTHRPVTKEESETFFGKDIPYEKEYDENGNEIKYICYNSDGSIAIWSETEYDCKGEQKAFTEYYLDGSIKKIREYDKDKNIIKCTYYNPDGEIVSVKDEVYHKQYEKKI